MKSRWMTRRQALVKCCVASLLLPNVGCQGFSLFSKKDEKKERMKNVDGALMGKEGHSNLVGDYITISNLHAVKVEGVGYVTGLNGTGEDPPATPYRKEVLDDMRRRKIENPETLLRSTNSSVVLILGFLPPLIKKGERFDVDINLYDGAETTNLSGGRLFDTDLSEHAFLGGALREGHKMATCAGPILVGTSGDKAKDSGSLRTGTIPGGAVYLGSDRNLTISMRPHYISVKMARKISDRIGSRFHDFNAQGLKKPMAIPKTDCVIELDVPERYRDNYPRYLQCIRHIRLNESTIDRHLRLQELREEIVIGATAEKASLELEGIGPDAAPILREGVKSKSPEARFHAGMALAYLGKPEGIPALLEAADKEPAFRVFAVAALATLHDEGRAGVALKTLLSHTSLETKYGAFRALSACAPHDPTVVGEQMNGDFKLVTVNCSGGAFVHVTRRQRAEIVVFGTEQEFQLPLIVRAGHHILVRGDSGTGQVLVVKHAVGEREQRRSVPPRVADVIRAVSELGATYPDIVQMLMQAERQHNLPGKIGIDELPQAGRVYQRTPEDLGEGDNSNEARMDNVQAPNLFSTENQFSVDAETAP